MRGKVEGKFEWEGDVNGRRDFLSNRLQDDYETTVTHMIVIGKIHRLKDKMR